MSVHGEKGRAIVRDSLRSVLRHRTFAATVVLILGLGIGCSTAMFAVIHGVLLRPLPYPESGRLFHVSMRGDDRDDGRFSLGLYEAVRNAESMAMSAFNGGLEDTTFVLDGQPEALVSARVSANFLDVLGVNPALGRSFFPDEGLNGGPAVAMIGSNLWRQRLGAATSAIGQQVMLGAVPHTIIGVLPDGFEFPFPGVDVWVSRPAETSTLNPRFWPFVNLLYGVGRLQPGATLDQARAELQVLIGNYAVETSGNTDAADLRLAPLNEDVVGDARTPLWLLFGAFAFVLMIACSNVASLMLLRTTHRTSEFAIRRALGAPRSRIAWQMLVESLSLALIAGLLAVIVITVGLRVFTISANLLPRAAGISVDPVVLGFALGVSLLTGIVCGLLPCLQLRFVDAGSVLREVGAIARKSRGSGAPLRIGTGDFLLVAQVALSLVLLVGAGLLLMSFGRIIGVQPGVRVDGLLTMKVALPVASYDTPERRAVFFEELVRRVPSLSTVDSATASLSVPTSSNWIGTNVLGEGQQEADQLNAFLQSVTPGYLATLGVPLLEGRDLEERDHIPGSVPTMLVSEEFASRMWPDIGDDSSVTGRRVRVPLLGVGPVEVVGVVGDVQDQGLTLGTSPYFYVPIHLYPPQTGYVSVRTAGDPLLAVEPVRRELLSIDPAQPIAEIRTMQEIFRDSVAEERFAMVLLVAMAGIAVMLTLAGLYGAVAHLATERRREFAMRSALGASPRQILWLALRRSTLLCMVGMLLGTAGAGVVGRALESLLFGVSEREPTVLIASLLLFTIVSVLAGYVPARAAADQDPAAVLRS